MTKADSERLALEEMRAQEVKRDIRLLVLFGAMVFLMIAELGYGGVVGKALSSVMFGLFGMAAYAIPPFVFITVLFVISNMGRRTLPARTAALVSGAENPERHRPITRQRSISDALLRKREAD